MNGLYSGAESRDSREIYVHSSNLFLHGLFSFVSAVITVECVHILEQRDYLDGFVLASRPFINSLFVSKQIRT